MPSPVSRYRRGLIALTFDRRFPSTARKEILALFGAVGEVLEINEGMFDAFTVTYSSSHGYHALAALAEAGEQLGLDRRTALKAAAHALADGVLSWREGCLSLSELLQEAATPGGIAAEVISTMDRGGYRRVIATGLRAGLVRARSNSSL
jgi:pyrroline-5-carboxylate reductase